MMTYKRFKSAWDNFGKFLYQLQPKTKAKETWKDPLKIIQKKMCLYYLNKHA